MPTSKIIKIQKNKILTYSINKTGYQTVNKSLVVTEDTSINEDLTPTTGNPILYLSEDHCDRIFDCATFVCYFTPSGTYDVDSLKYISATQTTGRGLTDIQVVKELWLAQIETVLSIETPKGTSNNFVFTYNGATWDLTGATTISGISQTVLSDVYGISFTGTATAGDVITVTETQYNKFAVYVLDANYRSNQAVGPKNHADLLPVKYASDPQNARESATYCNEYMWNYHQITTYPIFNYAKNLGNFILSNGIKINAVVPNGYEIQEIYNNRVILDSFDPIIQSGSTAYNLTNWDFRYNNCWICTEATGGNSFYYTKDRGFVRVDWREEAEGFCAIFEVPVM